MWAVIVLFLVALGGGVAGGYALSYQQAQQSVLKTGVPKALAPVISAYETVTNNYYKQVSTTKLTDGAIKGMLSSLDDPYSVYLQNNDKTNLDDTISASFGGIGATIQQDHNSLSIASILPGTPAKKAGMKVGDVLLKVNGKDVSKETVTQAVAKIRGKIGTTVAVTVKRGSKQATFSMKRKKITVDTVTGKLAPANKQVGVITISTFSVTPCDLKFADVNRDGEITPEDRTMIGNPTPDFTYGLSLGVNYKNWSLGIDMMGQHGNEIFRTWDNYNFAQFNYLSQRMDRWHGEGTSNSQPLLNSKHSINNLNSEYYIEDGSFFRIRNVQLAYSFDKALLAKIRLQALKVYVNIQNLKTWKHNTGYTPELGGSATTFGVDDGSYPVPAVYTFGINLTF